MVLLSQAFSKGINLLGTGIITLSSLVEIGVEILVRGRPLRKILIFGVGLGLILVLDYTVPILNSLVLVVDVFRD